MPITRPVLVSLVESGMCAIPKSMTPAARRRACTLPGLRSRCTTPAAWMAASASASPSASASSAMPRSGPSWRTASSSVRPGTYLVTMYGDGAAARRRRPPRRRSRFLTRRMVSTSRASRCLASGSLATAGPSTLIATGRRCPRRCRGRQRPCRPRRSSRSRGKGRSCAGANPVLASSSQSTARLRDFYKTLVTSPRSDCGVPCRLGTQPYPRSLRADDQAAQRLGGLRV